MWILQLQRLYKMQESILQMLSKLVLDTYMVKVTSYIIIVSGSANDLYDYIQLAIWYLLHMYNLLNNKRIAAEFPII